MKNKTLSLAIALVLNGGVAMANDTANSVNEADIEHVVVSSRVAKPLREVATSVTVITEEDIQLRGVATIAELLRLQPSVGVSNSGGAGAATSIRIRGEEAFRTLVRIDGVDVSDPTTVQVQPQLAHQLTNNLSRVEILRGSQGMAYGADAGGVINITSADTSEPFAGNVAAEVGTFSTTNLSANVGGNQNGLNYFFSASDFYSSGFNRRTADSVNPDDDSYKNTTYHTKLGYAIDDNWSVDLVARQTQGTTEYDGCGFGTTYSHDCVSDFDQKNLRGAVNYQGDYGVHQLAYAKTDVERESFNQGMADLFSTGEIERVEYLGQNALTDSANLVYGFDWEEESVTSNDASRIQKGYYAEYQDALQTNWFVTAGVRFDDNDDFGQHTSYRLSSAYIIPLGADELKLRTAYGTGFRAPSLFEIDYNTNFGFAPATDNALVEEKTEGFEFGIEYHNETGSSAEVVYFNQRITNGIGFDIQNYSGYIQNNGTARSEGVELITDWAISDTLRFIGNYTYNDAKDTAEAQRLRRPRHLANLGVQFQANAFSAVANLRVSQDAIDFGGVALDDYKVFDVSANYQVSENWVVQGRIENLFDEEYEEVSGFNVAGQSINLGARFTF